VIASARSRAGTYAEWRYRRGLRSWRARNRRLFAAYLGPFIVAGIAVGILAGNPVAWLAGLLAGAFIAIWIAFREMPPRYVEHWRDGAEGERKTERALKPLERAGWHVSHDVQNGRGNYDHIVVGPSGVYLLDSKNLQGIVDIRDGVPHLARRHDPDSNVVFKRIQSHTLAAAAGLKEEIQARTGHRTWVQAVVVFWSEFPEGFAESDRCVFISGPWLCDWLEGRPDRLSRASVEEIAAGVEEIARGIVRAAPSAAIPS
jgi:hypothetical protein